jgi:protein phosphatase
MAIDFSDTGEFDLPPPAIETLLRLARAAHPRVDLAGLTHPGLVRERNEDVYLLVQADRSLRVRGTNLPEADMPLHFEETGYGMLVADGMGGMAGGDVASRMATQTLTALVLSTPDWIMLTGDEENIRILERMVERYRAVDSAVREEATVNPNLAGMGTTMTIAYSLGTQLFVGHVGDSRAYLYRGTELHRLTRDHTMAQALADQAIIAAHEIATHHFRHVLTRFIGAGRPVAADVMQTLLVNGDQVLVCSDGLTEMLPEPQIATILRAALTAEEGCRLLIDAALKEGGKDNVTVAIARYHIPEAG